MAPHLAGRTGFRAPVDPHAERGGGKRLAVYDWTTEVREDLELMLGSELLASRTATRLRARRPAQRTHVHRDALERLAHRRGFEAVAS
ncbi:MAG: hypothetical protein KDC95_18380 [Planctomycetes bacterium]|nr:hypothetical protein [Planctomycetota bacterium]